MCMISKNIEKCSSSTTKFCGSAMAAGLNARAAGRAMAERVRVFRLINIMVMSPLIKPVNIHEKRPHKQRKGGCKGGAGKQRIDWRQYRHKQGNDLPHANRLTSETVRQRRIQPIGEVAGSNKGVTNKAKGQHPDARLAQCQNGDTEPEDEKGIQFHVEPGAEVALGARRSGDFAVH